MARFIGGEHDGADYYVSLARGQRRIKLPSAERTNEFTAWSLDTPALAVMKVEEYRLERVECVDRFFEVWVVDGMSVDMMMNNLIQHYRTLPEERQIDERKTFEAMIERRRLPVSRHQGSDDFEGSYKLPAVQLAWEAWLESACNSPRPKKD